MGLTKQYLRYTPAGNFNIIVSPTCNVVFITLEGQEGRFVAAGACEHVIIWDLRLGEKAQVLTGEKAIVTRICASPNKRHLAAGYSDGCIQVYDLRSAEIVGVFAGHKSDITTLTYDNLGHRLASGSKDNDIVVWDVVAETGLCRLSGHCKPVSEVTFMLQQNILISGSKDGFIKFWDLETHHCFKTLVTKEYDNEIWSVALVKNDEYLISGGKESDLIVWKLVERDPDIAKKNPIEHLASQLKVTSLEDDSDPTHPLQCHMVGSLPLLSTGPLTLVSDESRNVIGCHRKGKQIELFYFRSDSEAQLRLKKRVKKLQKKKQKQESSMEVDEVSEESVQLSLRDAVKRLKPISLSKKRNALSGRAKSFHLVLGSGGELRLVAGLSNNIIKLYRTTISENDTEPEKLRCIKSQGHHSEVRSVSFSSDNLAIVSGSAESVKVWNRSSQACLRTVPTSEYVLSTIFVPGDRHVLAGCKSGKLLIIDIASGDILEEIPGHNAEIWSVCLLPDLRGCATGSEDKLVKFWQFELIVDVRSENRTKVLSLLHTRTLVLEASVLHVRFSPNCKFVAVAQSDMTVSVFYVDTFKLFHSLYGHKLPVTCMDISFDSALIATASADCKVKIWGMDFGDTQKSILAHDDIVTGLQFVPKTHLFFTCGKDGKIKQWDGDKFIKIITLHGHAGMAWSLAVSPNGNHVVSSGSDRVLRMYEKSDQILVLEDEQEEEREQQEGLVTGEDTVVPGHSDLNLPSKKTIGSEKGAESILECLEVCKIYSADLAEYNALTASSDVKIPKPKPPLLMQAFHVKTCDDFVLETFKRIRSSDLEQALAILPFNAVMEIFQYLPSLMERGYCIELLCKVMLFLLKLHHAPIVTSETLLPILENLLEVARPKVEEFRDVTGYNLYGLQFMQREREAAEGIQLFKDLTTKKRRSDRKRKQRDNLKRSHMVMSSG